MIRSRGAVIRPPYSAELSPVMPGFDDTASMAKWEPLIRFNVCMMELYSNLLFEQVPPPPAPPGPTPAPVAARIVHIQRTGPGTFVAVPVVALERPAADIMEAQLVRVFEWARHREDRASEILTQLAPQTPFWAAVANLQPTRTRFTHELIEVGLALASITAMRFKQAFACPRPVAYSPKIQPMIPTPEHSTLPSGHAAEAYMVAHLLGALIPAPHGQVVHAQLAALAGRIAINRTVAGVHFPVDSIAGRLLGATMAEYLAYQCTAGVLPDLPHAPNPNQQPGWAERSFAVTAAQQGDDFRPSVALQAVQRHHPQATTGPNPMLAWLWAQARAEWA